MSEELVILPNQFLQMNEIPVKEYVEKKGRFDYLSWAKAHELMKGFDDFASVEEEWFSHYELFENQSGTFTQLIEKKLPYQKTENSSFVVVSVKVRNKTEKEIFPILDFKNQDVSNPSMSQVNKALKRAFVKALAKHGLGIFIYVGEDLPSFPTISLKDLEKLEKLVQSLDEITGMSTLSTLIQRTNKQIKQEFASLGLEPIGDIEMINNQQYGIFLRVLNHAMMEAEKKAKEKEKEAKKAK